VESIFALDALIRWYLINVILLELWLKSANVDNECCCVIMKHRSMQCVRKWKNAHPVVKELIR